MKKLILPLFIVLFTSGCASIVGDPIDASNGAIDKATIFTEIHSKSRFLKPSEEDLVQIIEVDGEKFDTTSYMKGTKSHAFYLAPGEHQLKVRVLESAMGMGGGLLGSAASDRAADTKIGDLKVKLDPNKTYLISAKAVEFTTILLSKFPKKYEYSIKEYTGSEPPVIAVDY